LVNGGEVSSSPSTIRYENHAAMYQFDVHTGWYGKPNIETRYESPDGALVTVNHNSLGNRDVERAPAKAAKRIAVVGASLSWGMGVEFSDIFPQRLERLLGCEVLNFGHCNFGLDQCLITLKDRVAAFRPDIVVLEQQPWVIYRLLLSSLKQFPKPYFDLSADGKLLLRDVPLTAQIAPVRQLISAYRAYAKEVVDQVNNTDVTHEYDPALDPLFSYLRVEHYTRLYSCADAILREIAGTTKALNAKLLVVVGTTLQELTRRPTSQLVDFGLPRKRLRGLLARAAIPHLDLQKPMHARHGDKPVIFYEGHWNAYGHSVVAEMIAARLVETKWA
jgi:hypothetical protein